MTETWTPVKSYTGFKHCRQCGQYRPNVENGRCSECRGVQTDAENDSGQAVERSTDEKRITPDTPLKAAALAAIEEFGGLRPAARELSKKRGYKINHGVIGLAADGQDFPAARRALGLPPKTVPVEPCADCGEVHEQLHTCADDRQRNKRTAANGHFRRAVWIHEDDMPLFDALLARHGVRTLQELIDNHMIFRRRLDDDRRND